MMSMTFPSIYFRETQQKGRGVFSAGEIEENNLIERCPVILIPSVSEVLLIGCSSLRNYVFRWITDDDTVAVVLGYGFLYNHSSSNNACYKMNAEENVLDIVSLRAIRPGEEITISYSGSNKQDPTKWFKDKGIEYVE